MRLISSHVDNFGGLHNFDHNFDDGLNIVLEDNGWGKTTFAAFLKAMIYGLDSKRSKDVTENERLRYQPWQGGKYGGYLVFEAEGKKYRIERTFGETPRFDKAKVMDLQTHMQSKLDPDELGEYLFHLDANAFQRSVFINQNGILMEGNAASSIHTRLNALISQANDLAAYDGAINELTQQIKVYEKTGNRGLLGDVSRAIAEKEKVRDRLAIEIRHQDESRVRIAQIDRQLTDIERKLAEKKKYLEKISGDAKKKEAAQKLLLDLEQQIEPISDQLESIKKELGGNVPESERLEDVKAQQTRMTSLEEQLKALEKNDEKLKSDLEKIQGQYAGELPNIEILDEIQSGYSELQGVLSTGENGTKKKPKPKGYDLFAQAIQEDQEYLLSLEDALFDNESVIRDGLVKREALRTEKNHASEKWTVKKKEYLSASEEAIRLQGELKIRELLNPEKCEESISQLEELQRKDQAIESRGNELNSAALTWEEEKKLSVLPEIPSEESSKVMLSKVRNAVQLQAEVTAMDLRLEGEQSRANGLRSTLSDLRQYVDQRVEAVKEPKNTLNILLLVVGVLLAAVAIFLWMQNQDVTMLAGVGVGALLAIVGMIGLAGFKGKAKRYKDYLIALEAREQRKKVAEETQQKLKESLAAADSLSREINGKKREKAQNDQEVKEWLQRYNGVASDLSEDAVRFVMDRAGEMQKLQQKKEFAQKIAADVQVMKQARLKAWEEISAQYPEVAEMDVSGALAYFRNAETEYKMLALQHDQSIERQKKCTAEAGLAPDAVWPDESIDCVNLQKDLDAVNEQVQKSMQDLNLYLDKIELQLDESNYEKVFSAAKNRISDYRQYVSWVEETGERLKKHETQIDELKQKLQAQQEQLTDSYTDLELPERHRRPNRGFHVAVLPGQGQGRHGLRPVHGPHRLPWRLYVQH